MKTTILSLFALTLLAITVESAQASTPRFIPQTYGPSNNGNWRQAHGPAQRGTERGLPGVDSPGRTIVRGCNPSKPRYQPVRYRQVWSTTTYRQHAGAMIQRLRAQGYKVDWRPRTIPYYGRPVHVVDIYCSVRY